MALPLSSQQQFYQIFMSAVTGKLPNITDWLDGSIMDGLAGGYSLAGMELQRQTILSFNKTFIGLANGPEVTGGSDDLQTLAVDHYGTEFARPEAVAATDTQTFMRPNNTFGSCDVPIDTTVQTSPDANGAVQQYQTDADVELTNAGQITFTVVPANATAGATYQDAAGNIYTVVTTIAGGLSLLCTGTTIPTHLVDSVLQPILTGTLTKLTGTGDASIVYSAFVNPDCLVTVEIEALVAGAAGSAQAGAIDVLGSTLLDPSITTFNAGNDTGEDAEDDADYRQTIYELIVSLKAAVKEAIENAALAVPGIVSATAIEVEDAVVFWNIATNQPSSPSVGGLFEYFYIPFVTLFVAQASGPATADQIAEVIAAIAPIRAFGVNITVQGATVVTVNWSLDPILNPAGPNFALFSQNTSQIVSAMSNYIATLGTGTSFIRQVADAAILAIYGPQGTNDLVAQYNITCLAANATQGAVYEDTNGTFFTIVNTIVAATALLANSGASAPAGTTLTKVSGTGDATITFSVAKTSMTVVPSADVSIAATQNAIPGVIATV